MTTKKQFRPTLRHRVAMAMCATDTFAMRRLWTDDTGRLRLPEDETPERRPHVCVCTRDQRLPDEYAIQCANMLIKADAALSVIVLAIQEF